MMRRGRDEGIVLIMAMVVLAILTVISAAFIVVIRQESVATRNGLNAEQARFASRAGINHVARQIDAARRLYQGDGSLGADWAIGPTGTRRAGNPGNPPYVAGADWRSKFVGTDVAVSDETKWIDPYAGESYGLGSDTAGPGIRGKYFDLFSGASVVGRYAVGVADLDGRLHVYPNEFGAKGMNPSTAKDFLDTLLTTEAGISLSTTQLNNLASNTGPPKIIYSPGEVALTAEVSDVIWRNRLDDLLTVHPVGVPNAPIPINVNSARDTLVSLLVSHVPNFSGAALTTVVSSILRNRPFSGRRHLETVLADLAPAPVGDGTLTEEQFNDLLNSLNGIEPSIFADDGSFQSETSTAPSTGQYSVNFDSVVSGATLQVPPNPLLAIAQTGGDASEATNETWATEVKFQSQYFHLYSVGRAIDAQGQARATNRAHAIYDAVSRKILYYRNNLTDRGNLGDL